MHVGRSAKGRDTTSDERNNRSNVLERVISEGAILNCVPKVVPATFTQCAATLPEWEEKLLHHTILVLDPFTVADIISLGVRTVSDGSEWDQTQGSFGWSLSNLNGIRCATGMGPAHGRAPTAYRSEGYGMLSILCFLRRLAEYTGRTSLWEGIVATDSQSLLDTLQIKAEINISPESVTQSTVNVTKPLCFRSVTPRVGCRSRKWRCPGSR